MILAADEYGGIGYKNDLDMLTLFSNSGLFCLETVEMPANNLAFVLKKDS